MKKTGFYIIKDRFFEDMPDPYLKGNKAGNRPHYYCFEDTATGIYWMIPLSSRIDKFRKIMEKKEQSGKTCDILHIVACWVVEYMLFSMEVDCIRTFLGGLYEFIIYIPGYSTQYRQYFRIYKAGY